MSVPLPGAWPSPITPELLGRELRLSSPRFCARGKRLVWVEGRSGGATACVQSLDSPDAPRDLGAGMSVRGRVFYGGGELGVGEDAAYLCDGARLYREPLEAGSGGPRALTPALGGTGAAAGGVAAPTPSPCGRYLAYALSLAGQDALAVARTDGQGLPQLLASGRDFYAQPAFSPDGQRLAYVAWDHPHMAWDAGEVVLGELDLGGPLPRLGKQKTLAGGEGVSAGEPRFSPDGRWLAYWSDASGFWEVYLHDLESGATHPLSLPERDLLPEGIEHGDPLWVQGTSRLGFLDGGKKLVVTGLARGEEKLYVYDVARRVLLAVHGWPRYTSIDFLATEESSHQVAFVGSADRGPPRLVRADLSTGALVVVRRATEEHLPESRLARAEHVTFPSEGGEAHGILYLPPGDAPREPPPLVVHVHGGPTSHDGLGWHPTAQWLATRGYACLCVNHRGSSGYGRAYRDALRGRWGELDVADAIAGARFLAEQGRVDKVRRAIFGGSAGGFTALLAMAREPGFFSAAVVRYGVTDLFGLVRETHKLEERYLDSLVGPLPAARHLYRERSPLTVVDRIARPVAIFQGDQDTAVPKAQSDAMVASLRARKVPVLYEVFEGEGHGFKKPASIARYYAKAEAFLLDHLVYG